MWHLTSVDSTDEPVQPPLSLETPNDVSLTVIEYLSDLQRL